MANYYCGPQRWPQWVRKYLSRYYNTACLHHDENYEDDAVALATAEAEFKDEMGKRRRELKEVYQRGYISYLEYLIHGRLLGLLMPRFTKRYGHNYK